MQFILSLLMTLTFGLTLLQCDKSNANIKNQTAANTTNSAVKTNVANNATPVQADEAPRITLAEAKSDFDSGSATFVDSRPADSYKVEHIKGSINVSLADIDAKYKDIPMNKKIIVYCS